VSPPPPPTSLSPLSSLLLLSPLYPLLRLFLFHLFLIILFIVPNCPSSFLVLHLSPSLFPFSPTVYLPLFFLPVPYPVPSYLFLLCTFISFYSLFPYNVPSSLFPPFSLPSTFPFPPFNLSCTFLSFSSLPSPYLVPSSFFLPFPYPVTSHLLLHSLLSLSLPLLFPHLHYYSVYTPLFPFLAFFSLFFLSPLPLSLISHLLSKNADSNHIIMHIRYTVDH
jgi:hypothetical protein